MIVPVSEYVIFTPNTLSHYMLLVDAINKTKLGTDFQKQEINK